MVWELTVRSFSVHLRISSSMKQLNVSIVPRLKEKARKKSYSLFILFAWNSPHLRPHRKINSACSGAPGEIECCFHLLLDIKNKFIHSLSQAVSHLAPGTDQLFL